MVLVISIRMQALVLYRDHDRASRYLSDGCCFLGDSIDVPSMGCHWSVIDTIIGTGVSGSGVQASEAQYFTTVELPKLAHKYLAFYLPFGGMRG